MEKIDEAAWNLLQVHLGYSDEEMTLFRQNPATEDVVTKAPALMNKTIVAEVTASHGCFSEHRLGQKIYLDGAGNLLSEQCPPKMCVHLIGALSTVVYGAQELFFAGVDPNELRFKRVGCFDVGVRCGGWGNVVLEVRVEDQAG